MLTNCLQNVSDTTLLTHILFYGQQNVCELYHCFLDRSHKKQSVSDNALQAVVCLIHNPYHGQQAVSDVAPVLALLFQWMINRK